MEDWQREHIQKNKTNLIELTDCNYSLLKILKSQNILSEEDSYVIHNGETRVEKSRKLYDILLRRKEGFQGLVSAQQATLQSGAVEILVQGMLLNRTISFQGQMSSIPQLLPTLDETLKNELTSLQIKEPCGVDVVVKNTIPPKLDYYIPRTIESRRQLNKSLFQENCSDVFLFQGLDWNELSDLAYPYLIDVSSDLLEPLTKLDKRHVLLESVEHIDSIVTKTKEPVHLIEQIDGFYYWVKSRGAVQTIQNFVEKPPVQLTEGMFIKKILNDNISVCLTDSPGMGKTVLLANLARRIVDRYPTRLVIFVTLLEFIKLLQARLNKGAQLNSSLIQTVISEYASDHPVGSRIISYKLENENNYMCFDGFDEVLSEQRELAKTTLNLIANSSPNCQMLVTARIHMRDELEQCMGTLGFHIAPFSMENQIEFLIKYWRYHGAKSEALMEFAKTCLRVLADPINKGEEVIAEIPLQCYMVGEVFLTRAKSYRLNSVLGAEVTVSSMAHLYETLINSKLDKLRNEEIKESLIEAHIYFAMDLLFPDEVSNFAKYPQNISHEHLCRVGIMQLVAGKGFATPVRFVHRTFAEYFLGFFAAQLLHKLDDKLLRFILEKVLATSASHEYLIDNPLGRKWFKIVPTSVYQRPVIAYFLNFQLQQQKIAPKLTKRFTHIELFRSVLAAVSHDSVELLNLYISLCGVAPSYASSINELPWTFIQFVASKHFGEDMLSMVCKFSKKSDLDVLQLESSVENDTEVKLTPLYVASFAGNYKIVDYLIRSKQVNLHDTPYVLHFCMWFSASNSETVIKRKMQIIKYLSKRSSSVLHQKLQGLTPILGKQIHLELLKCCIETGADVYDRDAVSKTVLHIYPEIKTPPKDFHELVYFFSNSSYKEILIERDVFEKTPLHYAVQNLPILSDTLKIFLANGADINAKDKEGNSVIFYASQNRNGQATSELLLKYGAKLDESLNLDTASVSGAGKSLIKQKTNEKVDDDDVFTTECLPLGKIRHSLGQNSISLSKNDDVNTETNIRKSLSCLETYDLTGVNEAKGMYPNDFLNETIPMDVECFPLTIDTDK